MKGLAVLLIILGIVGLAYGGFTWTKREKVVDLGSVEITHNEHKSLPVPPLVGGLCLAGGLGILLLLARRPQRM